MRLLHRSQRESKHILIYLMGRGVQIVQSGYKDN